MKIPKINGEITEVFIKILRAIFLPPGRSYGEWLKELNEDRVRKGMRTVSYNEGLRILKRYHIPVFKSKKDKQFEKQHKDAIKDVLF